MEVMDEGKAGRSEGRGRATCTGLGMNSREICRAEGGGKCMYLGSRVTEQICG